MSDDRTVWGKVEQCGWCDAKTDYFRDVAPPKQILMFACEKHRHVLDEHADDKLKRYHSSAKRKVK